MMDVNSLFHDKTEKLIAVLGQGYITSIMQGNLNKSIMVLSDKRLYQKGKIFTSTSSGKFVSSKGEKVCSVEDITGTSYAEKNQWIYLFFAFVFLLPIYTIPLSILFGFFYFTKRLRLFVVQHAGGAIATDARWYSPDELHDFQKNISLAQENISRHL